MIKKYLNTPEEIVNALTAGKTIKSNTGDSFVLQKGAFVISKNKNRPWCINPIMYGLNDYYIEEQEPLNLEVGKFYKTRSGKKAFVYTRSSSPYSYPFYVVIIGKIDTYCCNVDGKYSTNEESAKDLVAPWEE